MGSLSGISDLLTVLGLAPAKVAEAEVLLTRFEGLWADEKDAARGSVVENIFLLTFGDNAAVEGSTEYEAQRKVPW